MEILQSIFTNWYPTVLTAFFFYIIYLLVKKLLERQSKGQADKALIRSIVLFSIGLIGFISIILAIPMSPDQKGQITNLIGIVLSAVLGLSATTFIGNALAGIALKLRRNIKPGDFISVDGIFGRVTEQGLFHTEIQNIDRDLTTLPNMTLATQAVKVTRGSGTFINVEVSLGYDVHRSKIEKSLSKAAETAGLSDPFVLITGLGDFSVVYSIHGFLQDVKSIISAKSKLTGAVLDALHEDGIEIVSPNFMNQKQVGDTLFIPQKPRKIEADTQPQADQLIFDKAEEAESIEKRKAILAEVEAKIKTEKENLKSIKEPEAKAKAEKKLTSTIELRDKLLEKIDKKMDELSDAD